MESLIKHIPPSNIIYLIMLLKFNFWVACQPTISQEEGRLLELISVIPDILVDDSRKAF